MPLLDSSYLPPTLFILTHILGIAGILCTKVSLESLELALQMSYVY